MQFNEEFLGNLKERITKYIEDKDVLCNSGGVSELANLLSIYQSINNIKMVEVQTQFMKQSAEQMKNVDLSKFDLKGMLGQLIGK